MGKIIIQAKSQAGFWRCGKFHPPEPVEHDADAFTGQELARLQAEPKLHVTVISDEEDTPSSEGQPAKKGGKKRKG
jgi:hypothetical protein